MSEFKVPALKDLDVGLGKRTRLHRLLYEHGNKNGTLMLLPYDQGLEHGPVDFFPNPASKDPEYLLKLAKEGGYSGIVFHIGLAKKYMKEYAGDVPLVLKINGKTTVPSDAQAFSPLTGTVEEAVALGADAVGYTLYVGSPAQDRDIAQLNQVRAECDKYGMPLIVWSYPRGEAVGQKGGNDTLYAVDYAARVANELGADIVKVNIPKKVKPEKLEAYQKLCSKDEDYKKYLELENDSDENRMRRVVESAGKTMVLISGGEKAGDEEMLRRMDFIMKAGVTGIIFGRNMWQRKQTDAHALIKKFKEMMAKHGR
ncbi:MAG: fructose-bisphosphate aldolase [Candidatus Micrarchaeia archaeon]|jgi:class I fructose-bisphosphate aldolase